MIKKINIPEEVVARLVKSNKCVQGSLSFDKETGKITFKAFSRNSRKKDRTIMVLESGWLKESQTRMKFFSSVKKAAGAKCISRAMNRDLCISLDAMDKYLETYGKEGK